MLAGSLLWWSSRLRTLEGHRPLGAENHYRNQRNAKQQHADGVGVNDHITKQGLLNRHHHIAQHLWKDRQQQGASHHAGHMPMPPSTTMHKMAIDSLRPKLWG